MASIVEKARDRIPSIGHFIRRVRADPRAFSYDLLPIASTPRMRDRLARAIALFRPRTPGFAPGAEARRLHEFLLTEGITPRLPALPAGWVEDMRRYFEALPCHDPYRPQLGRF